MLTSWSYAPVFSSSIAKKTAHRLTQLCADMYAVVFRSSIAMKTAHRLTHSIAKKTAQTLTQACASAGSVSAGSAKFNALVS